MDVPHDIETIDDLSALAWVHDELRRSLEAAHKAMRRYLKEAAAMAGSDVDAVDPSVLRVARAQMHQGVGALELVGLPTAALVLRGCETALTRLSSRPIRLDTATVEVIERASFALLDYLARLLADRPTSPLAMFPQYRAVQELAGADRIHPADLWPHDWRWQELPAEGSVARASSEALRDEIETQTLALMRSGGAEPAQRLSDLFAGLAAGVPERSRVLATLLRMAAAFFEAQAQGLLAPDLYNKRVASRLLAQLRMSEKASAEDAEGEVSERLAQDLLFFCAQAASPGDGRRAPRLAAVRQAWSLARSAPVDYLATQLGRHDPAWIAQAKKRVAAAKEGWSAVAGAELHRISSLNEQFQLVGDSLRRLYPAGERLAAALSGAASATAGEDRAPAPELAMEVATSILYLEASLEDGDFDHPSQAARVSRLAERISAVREGARPEPLDAWMEELYRRVSDRQTMGSVVQELKASLGEAEKAIDLFFRQPAKRELLHPVPAQLQAMRGVFSVLGMEHASQAVVRMCDDVDALVTAPGDSAAREPTERLASNLGALGFLIDMLNVQPAMAKSLFAFDANRGLLRSVAAGGRHRVSGFGVFDEAAAPSLPAAPRLIEQAHSLALAAAHPEVPLAKVRSELDRLSQEAMVADQPELAETMHQVKSAFEVARNDDERSVVREELAQAMADFVHTSSQSMPLDMLPTMPRSITPTPPTPAGQTGLEDDAEMRDVFLEEAREVIANAESALAALAHAGDDLGEMTTVRRAFHTLKGSARMVGLKNFGEAAWACEQTYNARLAEQQSADPELLALSHDVLAYMGDWVDAIGARREAGHVSAEVQAAVDAYLQRGEAVRLGLPGARLGLHGGFSATGRPTMQKAPAAGAASMPVVSSSMPLLVLMPDLPSAADLDLVPAAASAVRPHDAMFNPDETVEFELDLGEAAAMPLGERDALQALALPEREAGAPAPDAVSSMMSLGLPELPAAPGMPAQPAGPVTLTLAPEAEPESESEPEPFKLIGSLRVGIPLFNIYLNEADEQSRRLGTALAEWAHELERPVDDHAVALAHSLAGNSATVGFADLSQLARLLEHALMRSQAIGAGHADEAALFIESAEEIRRLLHQFAAGLLKSPPPGLLQRLADHERWAADRLHELQLRAAVREDGVESQAGALDAAPPVAMAEAPPLEPDWEPEPEPAAVAAPEPVIAPELVAAPSVQQPVLPAAPPVMAPEMAPMATAFGALGNLGRAEFHELSHFAPLAGTAHDSARDAARAAQDRARDGDDDDVDAIDAVDAELFPIFQEEAAELLPQLASRMRDWAAQPTHPASATACMRTLHTLKGGARLAGAMRLGELAHRLETAIERLTARGDVHAGEVETLMQRVDRLGVVFDALGGQPAEVAAQPVVAPLAEAVEPALPVVPVIEPVVAEVPVGEPVVPMPAEPVPLEQPEAASVAAPSRPAELAEPSPLTPIDWRRFVVTPVVAAAAVDKPALASGTVRVRAPLLDRLVNHAGEVSISRARIEAEVAQIKGSLSDLTDNLERLRSQLREIELQAETQISSRLEAAKAVGASFDPLEMDRFTRFQELTRMMAESVNDVATVQRSLQRTLQAAEDDLAAQARLTRDLQDDLLRTRMVEFESLSDRLYRVARQAAKELHKQVRLDIVGGSIEVDRGVLERTGGAFEHLLRNCVVHGIEVPAARLAAGKDPTGQITVGVAQEGNEVVVEIRDDGSGLNLARIRERGVALGLLAADAQPSDADLAQLIFMPGFSTAETVTELAGRGIGMDVVKNEIDALGGRIETASSAGQGTGFRLVLPLTTAVTQVVMLRAGAVTIAVPATLVEIVRRVPAAEVAAAQASGVFQAGDHAVPFFWLGALLQAGGRSQEPVGRNQPVVVIKSAQQRIAVQVDEVVGNQEVVVKNLGAQLARLPGLAGITLLASGAPALIYNPVALATRYGEPARMAMLAAAHVPNQPAAEVAQAALAPLVLVVDDSLTVRRVTQRLLVREGYRVVVAKDGLDALEKLAEEVPAVVLSDIEMPRMDGFDLVRNMRADERLAALPVIMITSRIAQKHRDHAAELGVDHYLGKPYSEEDLLALVARYTAVHAS